MMAANFATLLGPMPGVDPAALISYTLSGAAERPETDSDAIRRGSERLAGLSRDGPNGSCQSGHGMVRLQLMEVVSARQMARGPSAILPRLSFDRCAA